MAERTGTPDPRRVVVAYDGSSDADCGLDWAIDYARVHSAPLEVFASSGDVEYLPERATQEADQLMGAWLDQARAQLEASGVEDWSTTATPGKVVPELIEASQSASLLVVGAQGHSVIGGMLLGSVSQHLTRHAHCPVAVVRGARSERSTRIVVGVDGSDASLTALRFAFEHAARVDGTVVVVHGQSVTAINGPWDVDVAPAVAEELLESKRLLAESVAGVRADHPDVRVEISAMPVPAVRALADASAAASLVVLGTRGRGGFMGLLLGSVSASVLQHAQCPVVVVR